MISTALPFFSSMENSHLSVTFSPKHSAYQPSFLVISEPSVRYASVMTKNNAKARIGPRAQNQNRTWLPAT
jgi:hypothetical protein